MAGVGPGQSHFKVPQGDGSGWKVRIGNPRGRGTLQRFHFANRKLRPEEVKRPVAQNLLFLLHFHRPFFLCAIRSIKPEK